MENSNRIDFFGIVLSSLCGIHCLITPLLIVPIAKVLQSSWVHTGLIVFMIVAFYLSIFKHFKIHRSWTVLNSGMVGLCLIFISYFNELSSNSHEHENHHGHTGLTHNDDNYMILVALLGATFLIISHVLNIRKCSCLKEDGERVE